MKSNYSIINADYDGIKELPMDMVSTAVLTPYSPPSLSFVLGEKEVMKFEANGDIFVNGKLADNDKEVVEGIKSLVTGADSYWRRKYLEQEEKTVELEEYKRKHEVSC